MLGIVGEDDMCQNYIIKALLSWRERFGVLINMGGSLSNKTEKWA